MRVEPDSFQAHPLDPERLGDHLDRLYRAAWGLCGSREAAEDLVQDTFAKVLARPRFLRNDDELGYLLRVLRDTFISQLRSRKPPTMTLDEGLDVPEGTSAGQPDEAAE